MSERYDAIVIGAGHNGLVCASLLGKAGRKVLVLEANEQVGGAAVTREFADGYSVSSCAPLPAISQKAGPAKSTTNPRRRSTTKNFLMFVTYMICDSPP